MRKLFTLLTFAFLITINSSFAQLSGTVTVGTGGTYATLTNTGDLFTQINTQGLGGNLTVYILSNITEPGTVALNKWTEFFGSGYTLTILPNDPTEKIISGSVAGGMITLNGAQNVTIDGNGTAGGTQYLRFRNTNTSNPTIKLINDACFNKITNCIIESGTTAAQVGGLLFSTTTGTLGNSNNNISYCDLRDRTDASVVPLCCLVSNGTSTAQNSNNTVDHCNIYNFYQNGNPGIGVFLTTASNAWTISNNSFYQTATRTATITNARLFMLVISNSLGDNFTVTRNYFGGTAPLCAGTPMTLNTVTTGVGTEIYPIDIGPVGVTTGTSIQGNTIQNISLTAIPPASANYFPFIGILANTGSFNVGNINANTIGSTTGNGSITVNDNGNAQTSSFAFLYDGMEIAPTGFCNISNNNIGSITLQGTSSTGTVVNYIRGILLTGAPTSTVTMNNNLIGSNSTAGSIQTNFTTTTRNQNILGIVTAITTAQTINITNNILRNISDFSTSTTGGGSVVIGIEQSFGASTPGTNITGNLLQEISNKGQNNTITVGSNAVTGIYLGSPATNQIVSGNTITGLRSTTTNSITSAVYGTVVTAAGSTGTISKNRIYDITNTSSNVGGRLYGTADVTGATWTYSNNQITITNGEASFDKPIRNTGSDNVTKNSHSENYPEIDTRLIGLASVKIAPEDPNSPNTFGPAVVGSYIPIIPLEPSKKTGSEGNGFSVETTNGIDIQGMHEEFTSGNTGNYYYNSVYIGGTATTNAANSYCFGRLTAATPTVNLRNNIFYNARTGGTGSHVAIYSQATSTTGWGANASNYNVLITPNSSIVGRWGTTTNYDIAGWRTISNGDKQSWSTTTSVISAANLFNSLSTGDLGIQSGNIEAWIVSGKGIAIAGQSSDFSGNTRVTTVSGGCTDIGSIEFAATPPSNPVATESAPPAAGTTTTYTLYGRTICSIAWSPDAGGSTYPTGMTVNYYAGIAPGNVLGGNYSNSYTTIVPSGGTLSNATYDLTYYFGDNETNTITTPSSNTTLAKYDPASWEVFQPGAGVYLNTLTYNTSTAVYTCLVQGLYNFSSFALTDLTSPLPVEICMFNGTAKNRDINLYWQTCKEINNKGFDVERRMLADQRINTYTTWEKIGFISGHGTTNQPQNYVFSDSKLLSGKYQYRLKQIDYNGGMQYYQLQSPNMIEIGKPIQADVSQNYPNPSNPKSKIDYQIPFNGKVSIKVFDIIGREVVTVVNEVKDAGFYTAEFDGTNLASGVYFYRISAEGEGQKFLQTKKMVLVK